MIGVRKNPALVQNQGVASFMCTHIPRTSLYCLLLYGLFFFRREITDCWKAVISNGQNQRRYRKAVKRSNSLLLTLKEEKHVCFPTALRLKTEGKEHFFLLFLVWLYYLFLFFTKNFFFFKRAKLLCETSSE